MGLGDITYSCNVISPSDTGGAMARWIRFSGRKVIKDHGMIFPSYDHYIRYYDRYGWNKSALRGIKKVERGMR